MPTKYTVKPGDHISSIAEEFKFRDFKTIWEDGLNAGLKALRKSAHVLNPGDEIQIPDKQKREENAATAKYHVFEAKLQPLNIRIRLQDEQGEPRKEKDCEIEAENEAQRLKSDGEGKVFRKLKRNAKKGRMRLDTLDIPLRIGGLDTEDTKTGQQARLMNLGYYRGTMDAVDEKELKSAIEEFQCDNKLTVDGICGPMTQAKLKEIHGS
ncbi:hypothetical protein F183_A02550 [Bryobacterales bacterium F-183]|nr:hypothetical protein F183_A02550 [Bryobacterales bacterium F-183]